MARIFCPVFLVIFFCRSQIIVNFLWRVYVYSEKPSLRAWSIARIQNLNRQQEHVFWRHLCRHIFELSVHLYLSISQGSFALLKLGSRLYAEVTLSCGFKKCWNGLLLAPSWKKKQFPFPPAKRIYQVWLCKVWNSLLAGTHLARF